MTKPKEISADERNIPAGWPRPYYLKEGKRLYTQWITGVAHEQILVCDSDRTYAAGRAFACSSCAQLMAHGFVADLPWRAANAARFLRPGNSIPDGVGRKSGAAGTDVYDGHYGSPICARCCVFSLLHCPYFKALDDHFGDEAVWVELHGSEDYEEYDETSVLVLTPLGEARPRVTTGELRRRVHAGQLGLRPESLGSCPIERRPFEH